MQLGSNIEYKLTTLFESVYDEKTTKKVEQSMIKASEKMAKAAAEEAKQAYAQAFKDFEGILNRVFKDADLSLKLDIRPELSQEEIAKQVENAIDGAFSKIKNVKPTQVGNIIQNQIKQLEKSRLDYEAKQTKLPKKLKRYEYLYDLPELASEEEIRPFSVDELKKMGKDFDEVALSMQTAFDNMEAEFDEMTRGTEEYYQALIKTREAASDLYRMGATINKHPDWFKDEFLASDYDGGNLSDITADFFDKSQDDFLDFIKKQDDLLSNIPAKLKEIDSQLDAIKKDNPEIINIEENSAGLKTLEEIEEAYKRILNAKGKIGKQGKNIDNALTFDPSSSKAGLQSMYDSYTKLPEDTPWEVEYQWLLKYVKLYESYLTSENKTHRNKTENPEFKELYNKLSPMAKNAQNMLESVLNFDGTPVKVKVKVDNPIDTPEEVTDGKKEVKVPVKPIVKDIDDDLDNFLGDLLGNNGKEKQKILLYRRVEGEFDPNRISGRSTDALYNKENDPIIQQALESGFGGHGDGLYASVLSGARDLIRHGDGENSFIEFDASNYNMYINKTLEEAELLSDFLLSLQKFVGDKTFLDTSKLPDIEDLNEEQLYKAAQLAIKNFDMSQEQFHLWLENARKEAEEIARLFANKEVPEDRHNFGTRFMKTLGYEGVLNDTEDEEYNGNYWGSVIYDPKPEDIQKGLRVFEDKEAFSNYLDKIQVKVEPEVISPIDKPEEVTGGKSEVKIPVKPEADDDWMSSLLNLDKYKTDNHGDGTFDAGSGDASSAELEKLRAENEQLIRDKEADRDYYYSRISEESEIAAIAEKRMRELEEELTRIKADSDGKKLVDKDTPDNADKLIALRTQLEDEQMMRRSTEDALGEVLGEKYSAEKRAREAQEEVERLKQELAKVQTTPKGDIVEGSIEATQMKALQEVVEAVTESVGLKTKAFKDEADTVDSVVTAEIGSLERLDNKIVEIKNKFETLLSDINTKQPTVHTPEINEQAFVAEGKAAQEAIDKENQALQTLRASLQLTTKRVNTKTDAFTLEGQTVGQVVGKEVNALMRLNTQVKEVNDTVLKLVGNLKNVKTATKTDIKVKVENVDGKPSSSKPKEKGSAEETPKRNKSDMNQLEKDYEKLGRLWARLDEDNKSTQSPLIENLEENIKYQQTSLGLTEKEIDALKEKMAIAEQAENRIIQGEKEQAAKDKEISDNMKFARSVKDLYGQYEKLGKLQAQADAGDLGKAEEARQLEKIIQQEVERLKLNEAQHAEVLKNLQLKQQEAKVNKANVLAEKEAEKNWKKRVKDAQKSVGTNRATSAINAGDSTVNNTIGIEGVSSDVEAKAQELASQISALTNLRNQIQKQGAEVSDDERKQLNEQINRVNKLTEEMKGLLAIHEKYSGDNVEDINADVSSFKNLGLDEYEKQLTAVAEASVNGRMTNVKFNADTKELTGTVKTGANAFTTYSFAVDEVSGKLRKLNQGTKKTETFMEGVTRKTKELAQYVLGSISIYDVWNQIRQGVTYIKEIDSALTELKKVTDETEETYDRFLDTASKTAGRVGSTIKDIVSSTADWARLGYSMEEAAKLAESTSVLLNVSEFDNIDSATSALVSTMQAFGYTANQSMDVVDVLNEVGNNFAISSDGIATALQDSASSLMAANNSYEQAVALIAAANRVVQDPNSVGSALRTISLRLRGTSVKELEEAGEDTTGAVESTSKLRNKVKGLSGVDILTESGAYKDTYTILLEISRVWDNIKEDQDKAALLELLAGKNRANTLAAILSNTKDLEEAYESAMNAEGSATHELETHLDSVQGKIELFNNAIQTMWNNLIGSDIIKRIVDLGTALVKLVNELGLVGTALVAITAIKFAPWLLRATTSFTGFKEVLSSLSKWMITASGSSKTLGVAISNLIKAFQAGDISKGGLVTGIGSLITKAPIAKILAIAAAIWAVVKVIDHFTTSAKEAAEAAEEALSTYKNAQSTLNSHKATIEDISDDYEKLSNGVDDLGRNVSLSTDEYKRYNEIVNQIAEMFPEMVSGYTEEGNAIISLKGNVDALTKAYEAEAQAARDAIIVNSNDIWKNFQNNTTKSKSWFGARGYTSKQQDVRDLETLTLGNEDQINTLIDQQGDSAVRQLLKDAGIEVTSFDNTVDLVKNNIQQIKSYYNTLKSELDAEVSPIKSLVNAYLGNNEDYQKLTDEGKNIAQAIISGFDTEFYARDEFENWTDVASWIDVNVVQKLQDTGNMEEFTAAFNLQTQFNDGKVPVDKYLEEVNKFIDLLESLGFDEEVIKTVKGVFNIEDYETKKNSAMEITDSEGDAQVGTLSKEDLDIIDKNKTKWKEEMELDGKAEMSWEDLTKKIQEAKEMAWSASEEFDKISEKIDSIQNAYSVLSDAVTQYNQNGYLTLDSLQALLSLEPEYLALLQMENGQLSINQSAMEAMIQTKLDEAKATAIQSAITQLNALAAKTEADAINDSSTASTNAISGLGSYAGALSGVTKEAIGAAGAVTAYNAAVKGAQANELVDQSEIDTIIANMNNQINLIDSLGANLGSNFKSIVGKNGGSSGKTALEKLQEKYERQIKDLEGQQTYIENEIEKLEAEEKGVSADYYEKQIDLEEEKISLYEQERAELLKLKRTDEVADAIWEVEHAIQESTLRMIEFRKSISELYATASERITKAYGREGQLIDDRASFIENEISIRETKGELIPTSAYDDLIAEAQDRRSNAEAELNAQADLYWQGIRQNGEEWASSDEALDIIEKIRQKKLDMQEASKQEAEYIEQQKDAYIAYYDKMMEAYSYRNDFIQGQSDFAQSYIDRLGVLNINVPDEAYEKIAEIQELSAAGLREQLAFANSELAKFEAQGIDKNDPRYIEKFNEALALEKEIYEKETEVYETHQQIFDNQIDRFNQVIDRINDATQRMQNISSLLDREDVATEDGEWTAEGLTRLGMAYQQMEYYKQSADEVADKMKEVERAYRRGEISEKKYYETMQELEGQQWDAINSYEDMKDTIIDLNEARIDMIEEGMDKEIEAYQELIDLKKEELDAERDLYDFKKDVQKQTKDIAALERRIASMSGSTDASTIAERTKLESELRELQEGLDDTYYNHAMDSQQNALDDELEAFTKSSEDYLESLRESIKDTDLLIEATFTDVMQNGQTVLETLTTLSNTYGFQLDGYLTSPWKNATNSSVDFDTYATQHFNSVYNAVETKTSELTGYTKAPWEVGEGQAKVFNEKSTEYMDGVVTHAEQEYKTQLQGTLDYPWLQANGQASWGKGVKGVLDQAVSDAQEAGRKIAEALNVEPPSYEGTGDTGDTGYVPTGGGGGTVTKLGTTQGASGTKGATKTINGVSYTQIGDVYYKTSDITTVKSGGTTLYGAKKGATAYSINGSKPSSQFAKHNGVTGPREGQTYKTPDAVTAKDAITGLYYVAWSGTGTGASRSYWIKADTKNNAEKIRDALKSKKGWKPSHNYNGYYKKYAKGTLGTAKDEWAITDESWIGEEITLAAGKNGQLQYLKKGSAVMPADISANLVEWGKLNPNMMSVGGANLNMISNAVNKPELNFSFDSLVHVDNCSQDTLKDLEKMVDTKINQFNKQLNQSLRKFK